MSTLPYPIADTQTDAKSPIDQSLMDAIRLNQEFLCDEIAAQGTENEIDFKVNGAIYTMRELLSIGAGKKVDGASITNAVTFTKARLFSKFGGTSGSMEVDVFRSVDINRPITFLNAQYRNGTQSIGRTGSALNTQAISLVTPTITTQAINYAKPTVSIRSIIPVEAPQGNRIQITFTGGVLLDSDYQAGDAIEIAGASNAANDGKFTIENVNFDGLPSVIINNPSGVVQTSAAGTGQLLLLEYVFAGAVNANFVVGELALFGGHTNGANDGLFEIYQINQGGNNILIKQPATWVGDVQGAPAGAAQVLRWVYTLPSAVDATQYIVGEKAEMGGHSSGVNDGKFPIVAVNSGGNNVVVYNTAGAVQGGAAGTVNTLRWVYVQPIDPSTNNTVGDTVNLFNHTNVLNDGIFEIKFVNRFTPDNIEIYNENGVQQVGVAGVTDNALWIINFDVDYSADFIAGTSKVRLEGVTDAIGDLTEEFEVREVNRAGAPSAFNIVIFNVGGGEQLAAAGRVSLESRSIFTTRPIITVAEENQVRNFQVDSSATFANGGVVPAESILTMDVLQIQEGLPEGLTLTLS